MDQFTAWSEPLPATTAKPAPVTPGMVVHSYLDISMYAGSAEAVRFNAARGDDVAETEALAAMPDATIRFYELPAGEPLFDDGEPEEWRSVHCSTDFKRSAKSPGRERRPLLDRRIRTASPK